MLKMALNYFELFHIFKCMINGQKLPPVEITKCTQNSPADSHNWIKGDCWTLAEVCSLLSAILVFLLYDICLAWRPCPYTSRKKKKRLNETFHSNIDINFGYLFIDNLIKGGWRPERYPRVNIQYSRNPLKTIYFHTNFHVNLASSWTKALDNWTSCLNDWPGGFLFDWLTVNHIWMMSVLLPDSSVF